MGREAEQSTALIVEDDPHTVELLNYNLSCAGFTVVAAQSGMEALHRLHELRVDIILCDVMLPGMDGFAFREEIVRDPLLRDTPFIFLTAVALPEAEIRGIQSGADEYITKPFDPDVLIARVKAIIARRDAFDRMARIDSLTELLNRQALEREIERELSRLQRYPGISTLVFIDIDDFKAVNDAFGHAAGDHVLVHLSDVLRAGTRNVDIVGRYGGEEFVLFLPETPEPRALFVMDRMLQHFRMPLSFLGGKSMTFSAGVVEAPRDGLELDILCHRADSAMYVAKRLGKAQSLAWRQDMDTSLRTPC